VTIGALLSDASRAEQTLTILHTSEHHGQILPIERRGEPKVGGMAARASVIDQVRRETLALLLVDSGDILIGTAMSSFFRGEPDVKAMNLIGYHAMAVGNHEFDFGVDHLRRLREQAQFPFLCSNITGKATELPCQPSALLRIGDVTVGLISLLGRKNFPDTFNREVAKLLEFRDPIAAARELSRTLKTTQGADLVVAVTHQEDDEDLALLAGAPDLDVVIGGHTPGFDGLRTRDRPAPIEEAVNPGPVFVKTHRQGRTVGRLDLMMARPTGPGGAVTVVQARARNLPVTEAVQAEPRVGALIEEFSRKMAVEGAAVIGRSLVTLNGETSQVRTRETNLGNLLTDLVRAEFGTEVALINSGQIRDSIAPGTVDLQRVLRVLPFNSSLVTFTITGSQLLAALENSAGRLPSADGRFLQLSGLRVRFDAAAPAGSRVRAVTIGDRPLEPTRRYSVATDAFLADGGDGYTAFAAAEDRSDRQIPLRDLLIAALKARPLKASEEGRIQFSTAEGPTPGQSHEAPAHPMPGR
jgi:2',3'-cyclic-nucleotide 2'-phosphodiesterase (5'-nucleotidase family)